MHRFLSVLLAFGAVASLGFAQAPLVAVRGETPVGSAPPVEGSTASRPVGAPADVGFTPTWETQKGARTYLLGIPAPRGQIVDRNGEPLAQSRVSYNLAITFPTPLNFSENQVRAFFQQQVVHAQALLGRPVNITADQAVKHYKNRAVVPLVISQDLKPGELEAVKRADSPVLTTQAVYLRFYPNGPLAAHVIGYAGRAGKMQDKVMENNELLWPNAEGRAGLEQSFDEQLSGKVGQYNISFDASGKKVSEQISIPPEPGYNVVTTLDANIQRICEEALSKGAKRGAIAVVDPNNGDVLALASWPSFNPNAFIPAISSEAFSRLRDDPDIPLLDRAYGSMYPPGSTFKVFVGAAALQSHLIRTDDEFNCPRAMEIGNLTFKNWKKTDAGMLNFADALTQSCDTWFYQVGIKIGPQLICDWATQFGLGKKTGLPLLGEADGNIPNDEYMLRTHHRKLLNGDTANLSIGQGDVLVTPLQLAQAMGVVGNGGIAYTTRLVQQVQAIDDKIVSANDIRVRQQIEFDKHVIANLKKGMVQVVTGRMGTAGKAAVPNVDVAGKTGTAQWGPKSHERTAAWFAGFAPAQQPRYAFAVVYEGDAGFNDVHGGTSAAPLMGKVLRELFKDEKPPKKGAKKAKSDDDDEEVNKADKSGNERDDDEPPVRRPPVQRPTPPPVKVPFWKRIFG